MRAYSLEIALTELEHRPLSIDPSIVKLHSMRVIMRGDAECSHDWTEQPFVSTEVTTWECALCGRLLSFDTWD